MLFSADNIFLRTNRGAPPPRFRLGAWINYRKFASSLAVPSRFERQKLEGSIPYDIVIPWSLAAQDTAEFQGMAPGTFTLDAIKASSQQSAGAKVELMDAERQLPLTQQPVLISLIGGNGSQPFWFKHLYTLAGGSRGRGFFAGLSFAGTTFFSRPPSRGFRRGGGGRRRLDPGGTAALDRAARRGRAVLLELVDFHAGDWRDSYHRLIRRAAKPLRGGERPRQ